MSEDRTPPTVDKLAEVFAYHPDWATPEVLADIDQAGASLRDEAMTRIAGLDFDDLAVRETVLRTCYAMLVVSDILEEEAGPDLAQNTICMAWRALSRAASSRHTALKGRRQ